MAIAKVLLNNTTQMDTTQVTVTASDLASGITALGKDGTLITGTASSGYTAAEIATGAAPIGRVEVDSGDIPMYCLASKTLITSLFAPNSILYTGACQNCTSLQTAVVNYFLSTNQFSGCTSLSSLDLQTGAITGGSLNACSQLTVIVLRSSSIQVLANLNAITNTPFKSGGTGGTIYIPKSLYDHLGDNSSSDYKKATNWSTVDGYGTITWAKIEGTTYETHYADGTAIS